MQRILIELDGDIDPSEVHVYSEAPTHAFIRCRSDGLAPERLAAIEDAIRVIKAYESVRCAELLLWLRQEIDHHLDACDAAINDQAANLTRVQAYIKGVASAVARVHEELRTYGEGRGQTELPSRVLEGRASGEERAFASDAKARTRKPSDEKAQKLTVD